MPRFKVNGYAVCPVQVSMVVEADTEEQAVAKAQKKACRTGNRYVVGNSADTSSWYDWQPTAEVTAEPCST